MFEKELDVAIAKSNPKNAKALKALLEIKNIKLEDGKLTGLEDQLTALKESDGYLFDEVDKWSNQYGWVFKAVLVAKMTALKRVLKN